MFLCVKETNGRIFALGSAVVKTQIKFSLHGDIQGSKIVHVRSYLRVEVR